MKPYTAVLSLFFTLSCNITLACEINPVSWEERYFNLYKQNNEAFINRFRQCTKANKNFAKEADSLALASLKKLERRAELDTEYFYFVREALFLLANSGFAPSQHSYATLFNQKPGSRIAGLNGIDRYTFIFWTKKAAAQGEPRALYNIAERLQRSDQIPFIFPDREMASNIFMHLYREVENGNITFPIPASGLLAKAEKYKAGRSAKANELGELDFQGLAPEEQYRKPISLIGRFGKPGHESGIGQNMRMIIYRNGDLVEGFYLYEEAYLSWKSRLDIKGRVTDDRIELDVYNRNGVVKEKFIGKFKNVNEMLYLELDWQGENSSSPAYFASENFFDYYLTCEEMNSFGALAFVSTKGDLGSGTNASKSVDYSCPHALHNLEPLRKLFEIVSDIRGGKKKSRCDGTSWYAKWRSSRYRLLKAGFAPSLVKGYRFERIHRYLEHWSRQELYNHELYQSLKNEMGRVRPVLADHFKRKFSLDDTVSKQYADSAINWFIHFAAGNHSSDYQQIDDISLAKDSILEKKSPADIAPLLGDEDLGALLHHSANNYQITEMLIEKGADVDAENWFGKTPIFYAIQYNNGQVVELLIENGANVNHRYKSQHELYGDDSFACRHIQRTMRSPLMHAAQHGDPDIIRVLISHDADLHAKDENGYSVLDYANFGGKEENIKFVSSLYDHLH